MIYETLLDVDPSHYIFNDNAKYALMLYDIFFLTDGTNNGYVTISDISQLSFGHAARMNPLGLKKLLYYIQEAAPLRLKGIHLINAPPAMELIMNMAKPFMKKEMIDLVNITYHLNKFNYNYLPATCIFDKCIIYSQWAHSDIAIK